MGGNMSGNNKRRSAVLILLALSIARAAAADGPAATVAPLMCPANATLPMTHIRPLDDEIAAVLRTGLRRSPTLASLVARIESSKAIVYVFGHDVQRPSRGVVLQGGMSHQVTMASSVRVIKIAVNPFHGDRSIATIGHELWHALEVLDTPDAVDLASVSRLYERIGYVASAGVYETEGAAAAGTRVLHELRQCKF